MTTHSGDITHQVAESLDDLRDDFDVAGIVRELIATYDHQRPNPVPLRRVHRHQRA
jgi:hypothetical protein